MILGNIVSSECFNSSLKSEVLVRKKLDLTILYRLVCANVSPDIIVIGYVISESSVNNNLTKAKVEWFTAFERKNNVWTRKPLNFPLKLNSPVRFLPNSFIKSLRKSSDLCYIGNFFNTEILQPIYLSEFKDKAVNTLILGKERSGKTLVAKYLLCLYSKKFKDMSFVIIDSSGKFTKDFANKEEYIYKIWIGLGRNFTIVNPQAIVKNRQGNLKMPSFVKLNLKQTITESGNTLIIDLSGINQDLESMKKKTLMIGSLCETIDEYIKNLSENKTQGIILLDNAELYIPNLSHEEHDKEIVRTSDILIESITKTKRVGWGWIILGESPSSINERLFDESENKCFATNFRNSIDRTIIDKYLTGVASSDIYDFISSNDIFFDNLIDLKYFVMQGPITILSRGMSEFIRILDFTKFIKLNKLVEQI